MNNFPAESGDILVYFRDPTTLQRLIITGEEMEDGKHKIEAFHVAVALDAFTQIAALGRGITILPMESGIAICRPPYDSTKVPSALAWARSRVHTPYGWIGILDQALRDLTHDRVHLPAKFMRWVNRKWPYCSVFDAQIVRRAGWNGIRRWPPPDPETVWEAVKQYRVH